MASVGQNVVGVWMIKLGLDHRAVVEGEGLDGVVDGEVLEDGVDEVGLVARVNYFIAEFFCGFLFWV